MAVHRVLIERDKDVDLVAHVAHRRIAGADGQKGVSAANDRLVGVVGIEMKSAPREDAGEDIPRGGDALAVLAANADCEIYFGKFCHLVIERWTLRRGTDLRKRKHRQNLPISIPSGIVRAKVLDE